MYFLNWFHVIGSHLIILSQITNSLVLLTANVEDIKRIAQKFVSESLADQITDLIVKATAKAEVDVSQENNQNNNVHDVSKHDWKVNYKKNRGIDKHRSVKPIKKQYETTNLIEMYKKGNDFGSREFKKTRYDLKSSRDSKEYIYQNPYIEKNIKLKAKREPIILSNRKDKLNPINKDENEDYMNSINEIQKRVHAATTERERNEFDQYFNSNYPKAGIIATSGGVALTKGPDSDSSIDNNKDY